MPRYINAICPVHLGEQVGNEALRPIFLDAVDRLPCDEDRRRALRSFIDFQLVGERTRRGSFSGWGKPAPYRDRASSYEALAEDAIEKLAAALKKSLPPGSRFDAVLSTSSTGNIMPALSYRMARALPEQIPADAMMVDLGNVGCTGSVKLLRLATELQSRLQNILVISVEGPSTLIDLQADTFDTWQGNCTFGDGAAALWISSTPQGERPIEILSIQGWQNAPEGFDLIKWRYRDYYGFHLADEKHFEAEVKRHVSTALEEVKDQWDETTHWAVHPAGIALLVRLSRALGLPRTRLKPSIDSYRESSNMSSASILHILDTVAEQAEVGEQINLISMGAGFEVLFGRLRRCAAAS